MKRRLLLSLILTTLGVQSGFCNGPTAEWAVPPDAGISDTELQSMGPNAEGELLRRFADSNNEKHKEGLLHRMRLYGDLAHPSEPVRKQMNDYVETEISSCQGPVDSKRLLLMASALEVLGQRGGPEGIKYLEKWISDDSFSARVNCYPSGKASDYSRDYLIWSAVIGLGLSGDKTALTFLKKTTQNPPKVKYPGSLMGVLNRAVAENVKMQKVGARKFYQGDYDNIKAHQKNSKKR